MQAPTRCVNLDWLEVCALEPIDSPHDPNYFRACGFVVEVRGYGTKVWTEMFTLLGEDGLGLIEVRRKPKSEVIAQNICHLRLVNRACYFPDAADLMKRFLDQYGYEFHHITRVDICLDFEKFDYGDDPQVFLQRYIEKKYSKINQANIATRGADKWEGRDWNSVSWGAPSSDIGTKFYNKTMELYDPITKRYGKPYIRQQWEAAGMVDDGTMMIKYDKNGKPYTPQIWRVEFSIRSSVRSWFVIWLDGKRNHKQSIRNTLDMYDSKEKLLILFASLSQHYFHFKHLIKRYKFYEEGHSSGYPVRKDRCPDKLLFRWNQNQTTFKVEKQYVSTSKPPSRELVRLLSMLKEFRDRTVEKDIRTSSNQIIEYIEYRLKQDDMNAPMTREQVEELQTMLRLKLERPYLDHDKILKMARQEMKLRDEIEGFW